MKRLLNAFGLFLLTAFFLGFAACDRTGAPAVSVSVSKLTPANYDAITMGMSKAQVETILGPPTTAETKDVLLFKKTTYKYEEGAKFAEITFKNDEVDGKDGNLTR